MRQQLAGSFLIALGGNALDVKEQTSTTLREEFIVARQTMKNIFQMIKKGHDQLIITHGNGPQVGRIFLQQELTKENFQRQTPLDVCVADTQGRIGNLLQNAFYSLSHHTPINKQCVTLVTQVEVDPKDQAFQNPTKPIGQFYKKDEADKLHQLYGWIMREEGSKGFRRVVPSPQPIDVIEKEIFHQLVEDKVIAIGAGGGGIPVMRNGKGELEGIEAVIDKDRTSALMANMIGIETLIILTEAPYVCLHFGQQNEQKLKHIKKDQASNYLAEGHFPAGNMGPKMEAAIQFLNKGGEKVIIGNLFELNEAIEGKSGTLITH